MVDHKTIFIEKFEAEINSGSIKKILDMGSGLSLNFVPLLEKNPELIYVGIEPSTKDAERAKTNLAPFKNARVYNTDAYKPIEGEEGTFDLVISLSVLEHVKQIEKFLNNSVVMARSKGTIVHRWDLGHALYPSSIKERFQVWLGNTFPKLLPEHKFVCFLDESRVIQILKNAGAGFDKTTYHQMPNHKDFLKHFSQVGKTEESLARQIVEWEFEVSPHISKMDSKKRHMLFPAIAVWSKKF